VFDIVSLRALDAAVRRGQGMSILKVVAVAGLALAAGAIAERVKASEIFICEDGRQVRAGRADIEHLKRTDPCVAMHFGITLAAAAPGTALGAVAVPQRNPRRIVKGHPALAASLWPTDASVNLSNVVILNARLSN
jgi:hypothetical protein